MRKNKGEGFTLIELIVAISIFAIMVISTYIPYSYYTKKASLSGSLKDISQSLYSARSMAINGSSDSSSNRSIGLYLDTTEDFNNKIRLYSYPYTFSGSVITPEETEDIKLIKTISLPKRIQIDKIAGQDNMLFFFNSISGDAGYYYYNTNKNDFSGDKIVIDVSYAGATSDNLKKEIIYNTKTNIVDYN